MRGLQNPPESEPGFVSAMGMEGSGVATGVVGSGVWSGMAGS